MSEIVTDREDNRETEVDRDSEEIERETGKKPVP